MRAIRVASAALLGVGALALAAPAAVAGDGDRDRDITSFGFDVSPATIAAGGRVTLSVEGCKHDIKVFSGVFDPVVFPRGQRSATTTVDGDAKPGAVYRVTFQCGKEFGHKDLTIAGGRPKESRVPAHNHVAAHKGVKAGGGGTLGGFDPGDIGLGFALVAGSVGTAYYWSRRRTADDHG
ncbi:hypothetical protein G5C60_41290 [Streptomyces sp. HC44]|uniref:Lipoprotein n=1 Tax=Streptomyces scabichelini TaxID=2711217 RepID=A0A6G4VJB3_9ACTN|nr:hypothetical protein [Streptomyces scabichelini]NGO13863.1 hypothetical protein [Streptomyces scabichelini]